MGCKGTGIITIAVVCISMVESQLESCLSVLLTISINMSQVVGQNVANATVHLRIMPRASSLDTGSNRPEALAVAFSRSLRSSGRRQQDGVWGTNVP